jgi:hypothetical protein
MKRSRTLSSYFSPISKLQVDGVDGQEQEPPPPSSIQDQEQEIDGSASTSMLTVYIRVKVQVDLQADKSPVIVKGPFFP